MRRGSWFGWALLAGLAAWSGGFGASAIVSHEQPVAWRIWDPRPPVRWHAPLMFPVGTVIAAALAAAVFPRRGVMARRAWVLSVGRMNGGLPTGEALIAIALMTPLLALVTTSPRLTAWSDRIIVPNVLVEPKVAVVTSLVLVVLTGSFLLCAAARRRSRGAKRVAAWALAAPAFAALSIAGTRVTAATILAIAANLEARARRGWDCASADWSAGQAETARARWRAACVDFADAASLYDLVDPVYSSRDWALGLRGLSEQKPGWPQADW